MHDETRTPTDEEPEQQPRTEEASTGEEVAMESALPEQQTAAADNAQKPADRQEDARLAEGLRPCAGDCRAGSVICISG